MIHWVVTLSVNGGVEEGVHLVSRTFTSKHVRDVLQEERPEANSERDLLIAVKSSGMSRCNAELLFVSLVDVWIRHQTVTVGRNLKTGARTTQT